MVWVLVQVTGAQELGERVWECKFSFESEHLRTRSTSVQQQGKLDVPAPAESQFAFTRLFLYLGHQQIGQCPPALDRMTFFTRSSNSSAHLFWTHPHKPRNSVLSAVLALTWPKLTCKVNHHIPVVSIFILMFPALFTQEGGKCSVCPLLWTHLVDFRVTKDQKRLCLGMMGNGIPEIKFHFVLFVLSTSAWYRHWLLQGCLPHGWAGKWQHKFVIMPLNIKP